MNKPIKRHKALHSLSHDHHHGLILAQLSKKGSPEYQNLPTTIDGKKNYAIRFYHDKLIRHFADEEKVLYPAVKGKDEEVDKLFDEIIKEHRKIESFITQLESEEDVENILDKLGNILESHIRKEERELFVKIQTILTEEELKDIEEQLTG